MDSLPQELLEAVVRLVGPDPSLRDVNRAFRAAFDACVSCVTCDACDVRDLPSLPNLRRLVATHCAADALVALPLGLESVHLMDADETTLQGLKDALDSVPRVEIKLGGGTVLFFVPASTTHLDAGDARLVGDDIALPRVQSLKIAVDDIDNVSLHKLTSLRSLEVSGALSFRQNTFASALVPLTNLESLSVCVKYLRQYHEDAPDLREFASVACLPKLADLTFMLIVHHDHMARYSEAVDAFVRAKTFDRLTVLANWALSQSVKDDLLALYDVVSNGMYDDGYRVPWPTMTLRSKVLA